MNKKIKNRMFIYFTIVMLFVVVNVVISFGYLRGRADNNESVSTISIQGSGSINVVYSSNTRDIVVGDILPGFYTNKSFSVTSNISMGNVVYQRGIWYQIRLVIDTNEFLDESLAYSLTLVDNSPTDGITALPVDKIGIPNGVNQDGILVGTGYFLNDNITHTYNLKLSYVNLDNVDQSGDYQRKFNAYIIIDNPEYINITFNLDGGSFENLNLNNNSTMKVAANSVIDFPVPKKEGFYFIRWENESDIVIVNDKILKTSINDASLKAIWSSTKSDYEAF